ncbi:MAG: phosphonate ABC transporter ATP-binding protein [Deltaproteobacteria bacterium]|nr:phosphonate ABC transporter ATP-binding protein [Deltaproteobacteria bacterium]
MISARDINKTFGEAKALSAVSLHVKPGEMVALIGASGSGKSTLIRMLSGLDGADADSGPIFLGAATIQDRGAVSRKIRAARVGIGVIFQGFNLVGRLSVETNVLLGALGRVPLWRALSRRFGAGERALAREAMAKVGILETAGRRASTLSGGQRQRAAIARALAQKAQVILADEPIASLDPESSRRVMEILGKLNREEGMTIVVSLHQVDYAKKYCPRAVALAGGRVFFDGPSSALTREKMGQIYGGEALAELYGDEAERLAPQGAPRERASGDAPWEAASWN